MRPTPPVRPDAQSQPDEETDYRGLVQSAVWAACSVFLVKGLASILLALHYGATVEIRRFFDVIPYIGIRATRPVFASVVTFSGLAMALAAALFFVFALAPRPGRGDHRNRQGRRHRVIGWFLGVVITLLTLVIEGVRHLLDPPVLRLQWGAQSAAVLLAMTVLFVAFLPREKTSRSTRTQRAGLETPANPLSHQQESPQT